MSNERNSNYLGWSTLGVAIVGTVLIASLQLQILHRQDERDSYVAILNGIIEMKEKTRADDVMMDTLAVSKIATDYFALSNSGGAPPTQEEARVAARELMSKVLMFYRLEKVYYLSKRSGISEEDRRGFNVEISSWLQLHGMKEFFQKFITKNKIQTKEFIDKVEALYKKLEDQGNVPIP